MKLLAVVVVLAALAGGAGWAALDADAAPERSIGDTARATTPVLSVRRTPDALLETRRRAAVSTAVEPVAAALPGTSCLVVVHDGRELVALSPELPLTPASTQKLLVGAALLALAEPDSRFRTSARAAAPPADGVIEGDLFVVGGGDPLLSTDAYIARADDPELPVTPIRELADALAEAGVEQITGAVVGDGSRYDDVRDVPSWPQRYRDQVSAGPLSGLGVDDGLASFTDEPVPVNPGVPAADPPAHTAAVVTDLLRDRGIAVGGEPRSGVAPDETVEVAGIDSPPVGEVVAQMLVYSDNTSAELLLKEIGVRAGQGGSTAGGIVGLTSTLAGEGIPVDGVDLADGSGLDLGNRVSCRSLSQVLDHAGDASPLVDGLAVAGRSGTLANRMVGTPAEGNLRAKTGSLRHVVALAGLVDGQDERTYTFAVITNVPEGEFVPASTVDVHDQLGATLAGIPEVEPPAEILPTSPAVPAVP